MNINPLKFGIRGKLFLAFGIIALITLISSSSSWFAYQRLSESFDKIITNDLPTISLASELNFKTGEIISNAPILVNVTSERARKTVWQNVQTSLKETGDLIRELPNYIDDMKPKILSTQLNDISFELDKLNNNIRTKFEIKELNRDYNDSLKWAHADFLDEIDPLINDTQFYIQIHYSRIKQAPSDEQGDLFIKLNKELAQRDALLQLKSSINLLVGRLFRNSNTDLLKELDHNLNYVNEIKPQLNNLIKDVSNDEHFLSLSQSVKGIISFVDGRFSLFDLRRKQLVLRNENQISLNKSRILLSDFQSQTFDLTSKLKKQAIVQSNQNNKLIQFSRLMLVSASIGSVLIAILIIFRVQFPAPWGVECSHEQIYS